MADVQELSPADVNDDRPIAQRRKRRASSANLHSSPVRAEARRDGSTAAPVRTVPQTPVRKKRVRFSFPPDNSTGLTQRVARTRLIDVDALDGTTPRWLQQNPKRPRRAGSAGPTDLARLSSNEIEIQFKPIRQILSERTKRRLTRNHMSEAMNEIEAEKKNHGAVCEELALVKQELEELTAGQIEETKDSTRCRNLEAEIESLRQQLRRQQDNQPDDSIITDSDAVDLIASDDLNDSPDDRLSLDLDASRNNSGTPTPVSPLSPLSLYAPNATSGTPSPITSKGAQTNMKMIDVEEVQQHLQLQAGQLKCARLQLEYLVPGETSLPLASPTKSTHSGTESPSSQELPLVDAGPLLMEFCKHLHRTTAELQNASKAVAASQEPYSVLHGNFQNALRELHEARAAYAELLARTQRRETSTAPWSRDAVWKSSSGKKGKPASDFPHFASSDSPESIESNSFERSASDDENTSPKPNDELEQMFEEAQQRIEKLEEEASSYQKDRMALISALDKYRLEVKHLEQLITNMEADNLMRTQRLKSEHSTQLSETMSEHAQAIEDLDAQVAAETRGRREAEARTDEIAGRWNHQQERTDRDIGRLNVQIARLTDQLKERDEFVNNLQRHLAGVREQVEFFITSVGGQISWADIEAGNVDGQSNDHVNGREPSLPGNPSRRPNTMPPTTFSWGLLTPSVEGGRFRDAMKGQSSPNLSSDPVVAGLSVAGRVEIGRGKAGARESRNGTGIGVVMEEAEEE